MHLALMGASRLFNPLQHIARGFLPRQALQASRPAAPPLRVTRIMDGDLLAVQATREVKNGQIVVARLGEDVTVKRLRRVGERIELLPENPDYQTIVVEPGEPFEIEGLAVGLIRNTMLM